MNIQNSLKGMGMMNISCECLIDVVNNMSGIFME